MKKVTKMIVFVTVLILFSFVILFFISSDYRNGDIAEIVDTDAKNNDLDTIGDSETDLQDGQYQDSYIDEDDPSAVLDEDGVEHSIDTQTYMEYVPDPDYGPVETPDVDLD